VLAGQSGFHRRKCSGAELHVYNIRHVQHHAAQLSLRLRLDGGYRAVELQNPAPGRALEPARAGR